MVSSFTSCTYTSIYLYCIFFKALDKYNFLDNIEVKLQSTEPYSYRGGNDWKTLQVSATAGKCNPIVGTTKNKFQSPEAGGPI